MKPQVLFSLKNNEKIFMNVVCCSRDCALRVKINQESDSCIKTTLSITAFRYYLFNSV